MKILLFPFFSIVIAVTKVDQIRNLTGSARQGRRMLPWKTLSVEWGGRGRKETKKKRQKIKEKIRGVGWLYYSLR